MSDQVKILRLLEYTGSRQDILKDLTRALSGTRDCRTYKIREVLRTDADFRATCERCETTFASAEPIQNVFCPNCPKGGLRGVLNS